MSQRIVWMHGVNMQVEYPNRLTSVRATGPFVRIEGARGQNTWLHFPLPTPAVLDGVNMHVNGAYVSFDCQQQSKRWFDGVHCPAGQHRCGGMQ